MMAARRSGYLILVLVLFSLGCPGSGIPDGNGNDDDGDGGFACTPSCFTRVGVIPAETSCNVEAADSSGAEALCVNQPSCRDVCPEDSLPVSCECAVPE